MSIQTLITKVIHFFTNPSTTAKIAGLKKAVQHDYDTVLARAEAALHAGEVEITTLAHTELAAIRNATASALRRVEGLLGTGALTGAHGEVAKDIAQALDSAANGLSPVKAAVPAPAPVAQ